MSEVDDYQWQNTYWQVLDSPGESERRLMYHPRIISPGELRFAVLSQVGIGEVVGLIAGRLVEGLLN